MARRPITRRTLFRSAGMAAAAGAVFGPADALAQERGGEPQEGRDVLGPGPVDLTLQVNGAERRVRVEPRRTLLDALRGDLDLTGAKRVCDRGTCGACTVLLDGEPVYACMVLAVEAEGREVTTVEGLGSPDAPHAVQSAFVAEDALQCGFCTPGLVVACAAALRRKGDALTEAEARAATEGNLCRCGTYPHVLRAALAAARKGR